MNLYECTSLFAESMHEQFEGNQDDCAIFLVCTDGKKLVQLIDGDDKLLWRALVHITRDKETRNLLLQSCMINLKNNEQGTVL